MMNSAELLSEKIDFVQLVSGYTTLQPRGHRMVGLCPFHEEKTPSFSVDPEKKFFYCFGCHKGGGLIQFVMDAEKLTFPEALEFLSQKYSIPLPRPKGRGASRIEGDILALNSKLKEFFREVLHSPAGKPAREYLKKRGIDGATEETFALGYAPESSQPLMELLKREGVPQAVAQRSGNYLLKGSTLSPFFRDRLIIPILHRTGKVLGFGGRILGDGNPKYLNSPETPVYSKRHTLFGLFQTKNFLQENREAVLVEGYLDLISLFQGGVKNVVASLGTALTREQVLLLKRFADRVTLWYDADKAGREATKRAFPLFVEAQTFLRIFPGEAGMDPDDFIRQLGESEYVRRLPASREPIPFLLEGMDLKNPAARRRAMDRILTVLGRCDDPVFLSHQLRQASAFLNVEEAALRDRMRGVSGDLSPREGTKALKTVENGEEPLEFEKIIILFLLHFKGDELEEYRPFFRNEMMPLLRKRGIVETLLRLKKSPDYEEARLGESLTEEEMAWIQRLKMVAYEYYEEYNRADFFSAINEWRIQHLTGMLRVIQREIQRLAEGPSGREDLKTLLQKKLGLEEEIDRLQKAKELFYG